jgi:hypothetical protein
VPTASVVDVTVAVAGEMAGRDGNVVEVLTSETADLAAGVHVDARFDVRRR